MTEHLLSSLGIFGGSAVLAFVAGLFPLLSVEVFLVGLSAIAAPSLGDLALCCVLAAAGHQAAKTITYFAGAGALEHGRLKARIDAVRPKLERWNKAPHLVTLIGATVGLPPMYVLGFIAHPLMQVRFVPFTLICFFGRIGRYLVLAVIPLIWR